MGLVGGVGLAWRWRGHDLQLPEWVASSRTTETAPLRASVWLLNLGVLTGLLVGVLVVGPAGRLAMATRGRVV